MLSAQILPLGTVRGLVYLVVSSLCKYVHLEHPISFSGSISFSILIRNYSFVRSFLSMTQYINLVFGQSVESMFLYATVLVSFATIYIAYLFFGGPVGKIPGPPLAKLSRVWLVRLSRKGDMHRKMIDLHAKYGTLVRTGPNEVSVSDLNAIKIIYGKTNALVCSGNDFDNSEGYGSKFRRSDWYSVFQGHRKFDLFGERDKRIHSSQRRLVSSIYSMDRLKDLEPSIDNAVTALLSRFIQLQS